MSAIFEQDISISFAGEDEQVARRIERALKARGLSVFFAPSSQAQLLGERLEEVLAEKYGPTSRYVVVLVSDNYPFKDWARFELSIASDEEKQRGESFILPLLLADKRMVQIPHDKGYLDLRKMEFEAVIDILVEKVMMHRGVLAPKNVFDEALREWKTDGFIPGSDKGELFWQQVPEYELDEDQVEFLLNCSARNIGSKRGGLARIAPTALAEASKRLIAKAENHDFRLTAIRYLGVADSAAAEEALWSVYGDEGIPVNDRARAFELFWKCPSDRSRHESSTVILDLTEPWQLRRAAATNILGGELTNQTESILRRALSDPRQEVRSRVVDAVLRFRLAQLSPALIDAYGKEKSRKGKNDIKTALRHFNHREDVVEFGKRTGFSNAFFRPPTYVHDWVDETNRDWL